MEDYPRTLGEFDARFGSEEACRAYLLQLRWPDGFVCSRCQATTAWGTERALLVCGSYGYQTSVTAGTIFKGTHKPLRMWFHAIWWVTSQKTGASELGLQRVLGLGSYYTAWTWLHKLRRAMVRPGRDRISGGVGVVEFYIGGKKSGRCSNTNLNRSRPLFPSTSFHVNKYGQTRMFIRCPNIANGSKETSIYFYPLF